MKILSCDWGTSNFRLYLMDSHTGDYVAQVSTNIGIAKIFAKCASNPPEQRSSHYLEYLREQINHLTAQSGESLKGLPLFISGMASSSIGMKELPYASLPFRISGEDLVWEKIPADHNFPHDIYLISGLASNEDVMRGEEIQLVGMQNQIPAGRSILILPGTHSKHIYIEDGKATRFSTFMTGEYFQLSTTHSILSHSVLATSIKGEEALSFFKKGVQLARETNYLEALFNVRTNTLLNGIEPKLNYCFLSGLHIGYELKSLRKTSKDTQIIICCPSSLSILYHLAFQTLWLPNDCHVILSKIAEKATSFGHLSLFSTLPVDW